MNTTIQIYNLQIERIKLQKHTNATANKSPHNQIAILSSTYIDQLTNKSQKMKQLTIPKAAMNKR